MENNSALSHLDLIFCLSIAEKGSDRTVYHSRIDGLILPVLIHPLLRKFGRTMRRES